MNETGKVRDYIPNPKGHMSSERARQMQIKGAASRSRRYKLLQAIYASESDVGASLIDGIINGKSICGFEIDEQVRQKLIVDILKEYGPQLLVMKTKHILDKQQKIFEHELSLVASEEKSEVSEGSEGSMTTTEMMEVLGTQSDAASSKKGRTPVPVRNTDSDHVLGSDTDHDMSSVPEDTNPSFGEWFDTLSASAQRKVTSKFEDADDMFNHWSADARTIRARYGLMGA